MGLYYKNFLWAFPMGSNSKGQCRLRIGSTFVFSYFWGTWFWARHSFPVRCKFHVCQEPKTIPHAWVTLCKCLRNKWINFWASVFFLLKWGRLKFVLRVIFVVWREPHGSKLSIRLYSSGKLLLLFEPILWVWRKYSGRGEAMNQLSGNFFSSALFSWCWWTLLQYSPLLGLFFFFPYILNVLVPREWVLGPVRTLLSPMNT